MKYLAKVYWHITILIFKDNPTSLGHLKIFGSLRLNTQYEITFLSNNFLIYYTIQKVKKSHCKLDLLTNINNCVTSNFC